MDYIEQKYKYNNNFCSHFSSSKEIKIKYFFLYKQKCVW